MLKEPNQSALGVQSASLQQEVGGAVTDTGRHEHETDNFYHFNCSGPEDSCQDAVPCCCEANDGSHQARFDVLAFPRAAAAIARWYADSVSSPWRSLRGMRVSKRDARAETVGLHGTMI